jgi:hypothetical protein
MATLLEPTDREGKPATCRGDPKKARIPAYICQGQGICGTLQTRGTPLELAEQEYMRHYAASSCQRTHPGMCALR